MFIYSKNPIVPSYPFFNSYIYFLKDFMNFICKASDEGTPPLNIYALHFFVTLPDVTLTPGINYYFFFSFSL